MMQGMDVESLKSPTMKGFCDFGNVLQLWQSALIDKKIAHYHVQGPLFSGKTYLLESTFEIAVALGASAVFLAPEHFTHSKLLEVDFADWFFVDNIDLLNKDQQTIFIAWLNQCLIHGCKVVTTSKMLPLTQLCGDLHSRIQSAFMVTLAYPRDDQQWFFLIEAFFSRHYIEVSERIMVSVLKITSRSPEKIFPLMFKLAHQPLKLTLPLIRSVYLEINEPQIALNNVLVK